MKKTILEIDIDSLTKDYLAFHHNSNDYPKAMRILKNKSHLIEIIQQDEKAVVLKMPSEGFDISYSVRFTYATSLKCYQLRCSCPQFERMHSCKHATAACLWLRGNYPNSPSNSANIKLSNTSEEIESDSLKSNAEKANPTMLELNIAPSEFYKFILPKGVGRGVPTATKVPSAPVSFPIHFTGIHDQQLLHKSRISYHGEDRFTMHCECQLPKPCDHIKQVAIQEIQKNGPMAFTVYDDLTDQKLEAIKFMGLPAPSKGFEYDFEMSPNGLLSLKKSGAILNDANVKMLLEWSKNLKSTDSEDYDDDDEEEEVESDYRYVPSFAVSNKDKYNFAYFQCHLVKVPQGANSRGAVTTIPLNSKDWDFKLEDIPDNLQPGVHFFTNFQGNEMVDFETNDSLNEKNLEVWRKKFLKYAKYWWQMAVILDEVYIHEDAHKLDKTKPLKFIPNEKMLSLELHYKRFKFYAELKLEKKVGKKALKSNGVMQFGHNFWAEDSVLYFHDSLETRKIQEALPSSKAVVLVADFKEIEQKILPRIEGSISVIRNDLSLKRVLGKPLPVVSLSEKTPGWLTIETHYRYGDVLISELDYEDEIMTQNEKGESIILKRDFQRESELKDFIYTLHPSFSKESSRYKMDLPIRTAKVNLWLYNFINTLSSAGYEVQGQESLKSFRISKAAFKFSITSGKTTDWFDLETSVAFDSEPIELKRVIEAIQSKEQYILLNDGSHGIIPTPWIERFGLMLKVGQVKNNNIKLHPSQLMLLNADDESISDDKFNNELKKRQDALNNIDHQKWALPGKKLKAKLRPYQLAGFQWLQQMHYAGFGACLADDMGLGKTLQTIAFIDYLLGKNEDGNVIIVCPTSLLFNWQLEFEKFAPHIGIIVHHGSERGVPDLNLKKRVLITSYGTIRNDLSLFSNQNWLYAILDESQAIKNPDAQLTKAVSNLMAENRLILSGTPIQNNTMDLWSQFNFINQGLLGSQSFFKNSFAKNIDKLRDTKSTAELNVLIKPFILRRTKEQVAKDLPAKTESTLWCEMNKDQRKIYDEVKNYYRLAISEAISQDGVEKSSFKILEGLLKLRQICDSPRLLKKKEYNTASSAKIDELLRELEENIGNHKVLVFSQFTEMLALVQSELLKKGISFNYLDGSSTPSKRKQQVEEFQNNTESRVFLISLKAGGVGLNLTSADYVYLIDPWWNPAAEQQAIDRAHRIGQDKSVFAYRMICKDSIEEKILQLQSHKKEVAGDLIKEDISLFKKMTKEDILGLFS